MREENAAQTPATVFKGLFLLVSLILLAAVAYAGWIVLRYWDRVGV